MPVVNSSPRHMRCSLPLAAALCCCPQSVSFTSLFLASKIEETPCKLLDLFRAFDRCLYRRFHPPTPASQSSTSTSSPYPLLHLHSPLFLQWRSTLLSLELKVLASLGYSLLATHPQRLVLHLVSSLSPPKESVMTAVVMQQSFALLNTAYLSPIACVHPPHLLAISAIAITLHRIQHQRHQQEEATATSAGEALSTDWLQLFDVTADEVRVCIADMCEGILRVGDGVEYIALSAADEVERRRHEGEERWEEVRRREAVEEEQRLMAEIRRIAMKESLKTLRNA